jgi:hypothetical protein
MAQQQAFPPVGESRTVNGVVYVSDGSKFVPAPSADLSANIRQVTPVEESALPERSYGDMARSARDTAAEFLPAVGGVLGSAGGPGGTLAGQSLGQAARELIQRGGQVPAAIADIYRNLRSGDPNVAQAMMLGFQRGKNEGLINLVPGGREAQGAVTAFREGKPYTAAADTLGALLNVATTGASGPIRKAFMTNAPRATIGTLLGLAGSKFGGMAGGVVADETGMTPDQQVLAEAVGSTVGFPLAASLAHPKVPVIVRAVAENPVAQGLVAGGAALARGADPFTALAAAAAPAVAKGALKKYGDRTAAQLEGIASKERMQKRGITANREKAATKVESDAVVAALDRQNLLADNVKKAATIYERDLLLDAQKEARAETARRTRELVTERANARTDELSALAAREKAEVAQGKSAAAEKTRAEAVAVKDRHRAEARAFKVSDLAEANAREDIQIADRVAAQNLRVHEANIIEQSRATNLQSLRAAANKTRRDIQYSKIMIQREKNALMKASNDATEARQAELRRGMVGQPPVVREGTRLTRDGVTTTTSQRFDYPEPEPMPADTAAPTDMPSDVTSTAAPVTRQPRVQKPAIFEELAQRSRDEQAGMFPNRMGDALVPLAQDIARDAAAGVTHWIDRDGNVTNVDPRIAEFDRLNDIMSGNRSPASAQGTFAAGGTGRFGAGK